MKEKFRDKFTDPDIIKKIQELENSPQNMEKLKVIKAKMKDRATKPLFLGCLGLIIAGNAAIYFKAYGAIVIFIMIVIASNYLEKNRHNMTDDYVNNFLLPVLKEILPDTRINYLEGIDLEILGNLIYNSKKYYSNCHIIFGDDYKTEFCNLRAYHYIKDKDKTEEEVVDFEGQVLAAKMDTKIKGHIRIVPVVKENFLGDKIYRAYGSKRKDEKEVMVESIKFNGSYSIFSTDDFYTRLILDPKIIEILNDWSDKMRVCLYMDEKYIAISFESHKFLFPVPGGGKSVENLSLSGEYEKIRGKLSYFYELIDIIGEKF